MEKQALKERMLALEEAELDHARDNFREYVAEARPVRGETSEPDEGAQVESFGELAAAFDQPIQTHTEMLEYLRGIDFGPKDRVEEGAVVRVDGRWFVIAIPTTKFGFAGETLMGISKSAPIYEALEGCAEGDVVQFKDRKMTVEMVL